MLNCDAQKETHKYLVSDVPDHLNILVRKTFILLQFIQLFLPIQLIEDILMQ